MSTTTTTTATHRPFVVANEHLNDPAKLRDLMRKNGYVFVRNFAPKDKLLILRRDILAILREAGWVKPDSGDDVVWSGAGPFTENEPEYMKVYNNVLYLPSFEGYPEDQKLMDFVSKIVEGTPVCQKTRIGRVTFPQNVTQTTPPHQDFYYIAGSPQTYTMWTPMVDCPIQQGGLAVMRGSHRGGFIEHKEGIGTKYAGGGVPEERMPLGEDVEWHTGDFALGDFLLFHSHTIHKAMPNMTKDRIRLSTDNRYFRQGDAVVPRLMEARHHGL